MIETIVDNVLQNRDLEGGSTHWANWKSQLTIYTCPYCVENHGKIFRISILGDKYEVPVNAHQNCVCVYVPMRTKMAGLATELGLMGADAILIETGALPTYYITKDLARKAG